MHVQVLVVANGLAVLLLGLAQLVHGFLQTQRQQRRAFPIVFQHMTRPHKLLTPVALLALGLQYQKVQKVVVDGGAHTRTPTGRTFAKAWTTILAHARFAAAMVLDWVVEHFRQVGLANDTRAFHCCIWGGGI